MTLGKVMSCCFLAFALSGCSNQDEPIIGDEGVHIIYICRPCEDLLSYQNDMNDYTGEMMNADLHLFTTSSLKQVPEYSNPQRYTKEGDSFIEKQIATLIDPDNRYNGDYPIQIEYRTVACSNIRMSLYDSKDNFIADVTEQAHFATGANQLDCMGKDIIINASKEVVGLIKDGTTIKEYLEYKPMIFAEACFIFENINREFLTTGNYIRTEIELEDGTILVSNSSLRNR